MPLYFDFERLTFDERLVKHGRRFIEKFRHLQGTVTTFTLNAPTERISWYRDRMLKGLYKNFVRKLA